MTTADLARHVGRPRGTATDATILQAVLDLVSEVGVAGVTVSEVARRAGVARATVYLRWPSRAALIGAAAKKVQGGRPFVASGDLAADIRDGTAFIERVVGAPYFDAILPELMRAVLAKPPEVSFDVLSPNREWLADEYRRLAAAQGFDPALDPYLLFDLMFGSALAHLFATGAAPSTDYSRQIAEVITAGLRRSGD